MEPVAENDVHSLEVITSMEPVAENASNGNSDFKGNTTHISEENGMSPEVSKEEMPLVDGAGLGGSNMLSREGTRQIMETSNETNSGKCRFSLTARIKTLLTSNYETIFREVIIPSYFVFFAVVMLIFFIYLLLTDESDNMTTIKNATQGIGEGDNPATNQGDFENTIDLKDLTANDNMTTIKNATQGIGEGDNPATNQSDFKNPIDLKNLTAKERFHNKMHEFRSVGCKPRLTRKYTKSLLDPTDKTIHLRIYPRFQYVKQCMPIMNYCPGTRECLPTEEGKKPYKLHLKTEAHYEEKYAVNIMEHTNCTCQSVMTTEPLKDQDQLSEP